MSHQVRLSCQVYPALHSACRMVQVLTPGSPSGARCSARCRVVSDQVAVPSAARSGARRTSRRIRAYASGPYTRGGPPPCRGSSARRPARLKRVTSRATASPDRRPTAWAAAVKLAPAATARSAFARATRSARSLPARAICSSTSRSTAVNGRSGSFCRGIMPLLSGASRQEFTTPKRIRCPLPHGYGHDK